MKKFAGRSAGRGSAEINGPEYYKFMPGLSLVMIFLASVIYFNLFGSGLSIHLESNSLFLFTDDYLQKYMTRPGGLVVYAGEFFTQFYHNTFYGSLINSVLVITICLILISILKALKANRSVWLFFLFLTSGTLMLLQTRYDFQCWMIPGFIILLIYFRGVLAAGKPVARLIITGLFPVVYYISGSYALAFPVMYLFYNFFYREGRSGWLPGVLMIAYAVITFFAFKDYFFFQTSGRLLLYPEYLNETQRLTLFLGLFSTFLIFLPYLIILSNRLAGKVRSAGKIQIITLLSLFPLTLLLMILHYDPEAEDVMEIENMTWNHEWDKVIRTQERLQSANVVIQYYYNLALSEKGELCNRMFFAPQTSGAFSLTLSRDDEQASRAMYFYYAIGLTGEAHHLAYESMVQHGYRPENIRMLIRTELINGNYRIAERYLNVLRRTLFYKGWAERYAKLLYRTDRVYSDPELGAKIKLLPVKDFFVVSDDFRNVEMLLKENPGNRIAFEYKMARLLLEKDIMEVGSEVRNLRLLGYSRIPRHIEEAIVSLVNVTKEFPDMGGMEISRDTDQRFLKYFSELRSLRGDRKLVENGLKKTERNTFWYYLQFGHVRTSFKTNQPEDYSIY